MYKNAKTREKSYVQKTYINVSIFIHLLIYLPISHIIDLLTHLYIHIYNFKYLCQYVSLCVCIDICKHVLSKLNYFVRAYLYIYSLYACLST